MNPTDILRDAYRELDETGSLSRNTLITCRFAGIDLGVLYAALNSESETEELNG